MKNIILIAFLATNFFANSQAFNGKGDVKGQIGMNFQSSASGIFASADFGVGENISVGLTSNLILSNNAINGDAATFGRKFDLKARFNANLGNVFKMDKKMDVYPGLDLGLKNFGAHLGFRYFFTDGFGVFSEIGTPISSYNGTPIGVEVFNNQFQFNIGASFNL